MTLRNVQAQNKDLALLQEVVYDLYIHVQVSVVRKFVKSQTVLMPLQNDANNQIT